MSVKIIGGYLKLLQRVLQHYHIDLSVSDLDTQIWQNFQHSLQQPTIAPFNADDYVQLLNAAQVYFQRPIGLVVAEHATLQDFGLVGYLASTSLDLEQALLLFEQYYELIYEQTNSEKLIVEKQHDSIAMTWTAPFSDWQIFYELNIALIFKITESIVQDTLIPPHYIGLGYPLQWAVHHYERFFKTRVEITPQHYTISFSVANLKVRNIAADLTLNQVLSTQAKQSLKSSQISELQTIQLKHKIIMLLDKALLQDQNLQSYVAQQMHCSERTLQRQLKEHGLNFQAILDEYRLEKSYLYLKQGKSFSEIAERLKYADQSAFTRAFKRWSGQTPKQYLHTVKS